MLWSHRIQLKVTSRLSSGSQKKNKSERKKCEKWDQNQFKIQQLNVSQQMVEFAIRFQLNWSQHNRSVVDRSELQWNRNENLLSLRRAHNSSVAEWFYLIVTWCSKSYKWQTVWHRFLCVKQSNSFRFQYYQIFIRFFRFFLLFIKNSLTKCLSLHEISHRGMFSLCHWSERW